MVIKEQVLFGTHKEVVKSLSMVFYAGKLVLALNNPTL
jgi:hypothetical protein